MNQEQIKTNIELLKFTVNNSLKHLYGYSVSTLTYSESLNEYRVSVQSIESVNIGIISSTVIDILKTRHNANLGIFHVVDDKLTATFDISGEDLIKWKKD